MKTIFLFILYICLHAAAADDIVSSIFLNISLKDPFIVALIKKQTKMIESRGYPAESYFVTTKDNYILCVYRIPCEKCLKSNSFGHTPVMLFVHGLLASAPSYLLPTENAAGETNFLKSD